MITRLMVRFFRDFLSIIYKSSFTPLGSPSTAWIKVLATTVRLTTALQDQCCLTHLRILRQADPFIPRGMKVDIVDSPVLPTTPLTFDFLLLLG
jgi:hypothetical protein